MSKKEEEPPRRTDDQHEPAPRRGGFLLLLLLIMAGLGLAQVFLVAPRGETIHYDEFRTYVREDRVEWVAIDEDTVRGQFHEGRVPEREESERARTSQTRSFTTVRPPALQDPELLPMLEEHHVRLRGERSSEWEGAWPSLLYLGLTLFLMFFLWRGVFSRMMSGGGAGAMAFGKSRGKLVQEDEVNVTFDDVAGADEAKQELQEIIEFLQTPDKFRRLGAKIPKGVLLVGPPGTGKTLMAKAVAGEAGVPFISISGSEFVEMFVGVGAARVRDLFKQAEGTAPCIVFIDELDALGRSRAGAGPMGGNEEREATLNQLLVEMDGFSPHEAVILMAATNRPEVLDPALLRPGRFDRQVVIDRPDRTGRQAILRVHTKRIKLSDDVDLEELAKRTPGFAGADLANLANEAALLAARRNGEAVTMKDFSRAIDRVVAGLEKRSRLMDAEERERVAFHEVGHALCSHLGESDERVRKISIVPRGVGALGFTMQMPDQEKYLMTERELHARMLGLLGGRAAEEVVYGEPSTGAQNDLERATELARRMVVEYGMSETIGPVSFRGDGRTVFLGDGGAMRQGFGEEMADEVDKEVRRRVGDTLKEAKTLLANNRHSLDAIATKLLEDEQLEGELLEELLAEAKESMKAGSDG